MKDIFLIRHGRQDSKLCNVNVGLSEAGREQARLLGERLRTYGIEKMYASELSRAVETYRCGRCGLRDRADGSLEEGLR